MRLKEVRKLRGFTQQQVADATGIERATIVRYENEQRIPPIDKIIALASFYDVSIDYLVGRTDHPQYYRHDFEMGDNEKYLLTKEKEPPTPDERKTVLNIVEKSMNADTEIVTLVGDLQKDVATLQERIQRLEQSQQQLQDESQNDPQ